MNHDIMLPQEVKHVVNERQKIWVEKDTAVEKTTQLYQHSQAVGDGSATEVKQPFTNSDNPVDEIDQILSHINNRMSELKRVESEIQTTQSKIEQIGQKARSMMMMMGGGAVAAVIVIILALSGGG